MLNNNNDSKQTMWEMWFVTSVVGVLSTIFLGSLDGSVEMFPNYPYWASAVMINFLVCLYYGCKK